MVVFIFRVDPRKGQYEVKLGQIKSNFQIKISLQKHAYLVQFRLWIHSKNVIYFYVGQLEIPKIAFRKSDVITFTRVLTTSQPKM